MLGQYFYHEHLKSATAAFGSLFNNIKIRRRDGKEIAVPISYGPRNKWLEAARKTDDNEMFEKLLPRMSYEMSAMMYDQNRKLTNKQYSIMDPINTHGERVHTPTPYIVDFSLYIQTKNLNDGWQIVEQILPFFTPAYTIRVRHFSSIDRHDNPTNEYDMPIVLTAVLWADDYAGGMETNRMVEWTLEFQVKIHLFGPIPTTKPSVIYDARAAITTPTDPNQSLSTMNRTSGQVGGEAGWVSIDSDTVIFENDDTISPFVINTLMDSDGTQIRIIREFEV